MFRHKDKNDAAEHAASADKPVGAAKASVAEVSQPVVTHSNNNLQGLIEKNLKWSQIIYEQNRKINSKLFWAAMASWLRLLIIIVPLALAIVYFGPTAKNVLSQYQALFGTSNTSTRNQETSLDNLLRMFDLDPAKREQIKEILR